jgi:hypothetical protein
LGAFLLVGMQFGYRFASEHGYLSRFGLGGGSGGGSKKSGFLPTAIASGGGGSSMSSTGSSSGGESAGFNTRSSYGAL